MTVSGIYALMGELVQGIWYIPAVLVAGGALLALINAIKRGSGV